MNVELVVCAYNTQQQQQHFIAHCRWCASGWYGEGKFFLQEKAPRLGVSVDSKVFLAETLD